MLGKKDHPAKWEVDWINHHSMHYSSKESAFNVKREIIRRLSLGSSTVLKGHDPEKVKHLKCFKAFEPATTTEYILDELKRIKYIELFPGVDLAITVTCLHPEMSCEELFKLRPAYKTGATDLKKLIEENGFEPKEDILQLISEIISNEVHDNVHLQFNETPDGFLVVALFTIHDMIVIYSFGVFYEHRT